MTKWKLQIRDIHTRRWRDLWSVHGTRTFETVMDAEEYARSLDQDGAFDYRNVRVVPATEKRKGNPMATAKQIAARKEFARIMKSGGFGAARKRAAPKRRKANPIARHPGGGNRSGSGFFAPQTTPEAVRGMAGAKRRRKNPVSGGGRMTHPRMSEKQAMNDPGGYRDMNPAKRRTTSQRNEGSRGYHVEVYGSGAWRRIATFGKLPEAKSYALSLGRSNSSRMFRVIKP